MTHSIEVARASYQHLATTEQAVSVYSSLNKPTDKEEPSTKRRRFFTETESELITNYFKPNKVSKPPNPDIQNSVYN